MMGNISSLARIARYPIGNTIVQICIDNERAVSKLCSYKIKPFNKVSDSSSINHTHSLNHLATYGAGFVELKTLPLANLRILYQGYAKQNPQTSFKDFSTFFFKQQHVLKNLFGGLKAYALLRPAYFVGTNECQDRIQSITKSYGFSDFETKMAQYAGASLLVATPIATGLEYINSQHCAKILGMTPQCNVSQLVKSTAAMLPRESIYLFGLKELTPLIKKELEKIPYFKALPEPVKTNIATVLASVAASVLSQPFDVAKSAIQNGTQGLFGETKMLLKKGGIKALFTGLELRLPRVMATFFIINEIQVALKTSPLFQALYSTLFGPIDKTNPQS